MSDQTAFLLELHSQLTTGGAAPSSQTVRDALGWDFDRTSQLLERLEHRELVKTSNTSLRVGDSHLDREVSLTREGRAIAEAEAHDQAPSSTRSNNDRWFSTDLPVLRMLAHASETDSGFLLIDYVTRELDLRPRDVTKSVDNLIRTGYVKTNLDPDSGGQYDFIQLSEKGFRATDLWPTPESALDRMIVALEEIAANTDEDPDTRTRAQKFAAWLRATSTTVGVSVASAAIAGQIPGQ